MKKVLYTGAWSLTGEAGLILKRYTCFVLPHKERTQVFLGCVYFYESQEDTIRFSKSILFLHAADKHLTSIFEPLSIIKYKLACAYSEDSNQSALSHSLIRAILLCMKK